MRGCGVGCGRDISTKRLKVVYDTIRQGPLAGFVLGKVSYRTSGLQMVCNLRPSCEAGTGIMMAKPITQWYVLSGAREGVICWLWAVLQPDG